MKLRKISVILLAAVGTAALATGCCNCKKGLQKAYGKPLVNHEWVLTQFEGKEFQSVADKDKGGAGKYTVTFSPEGALTGRGSCTTFMGSFTYTGGDNKFEGKIHIDITDSRTTAVCPDQAVDERFKAMLKQADYYRLDMYMLLLYKNKELLAMLETDRWK